MPIPGILADPTGAAMLRDLLRRARTTKLRAISALPEHCVRFELIDRVIERSPQHLVGVKCVTSAEEYLGDHFPTFPVLPGVMMLEALVQAGRLLLTDQSRALKRPLILQEVRNLRYGNMVRPGQTLKVEVTLRPAKDAAAPTAGWEFDGVGKVEDQVAVQGRFKLAPLA